MAPGLTKLNIKPQAGSLNAMKNSFATATRGNGVSYGIMAQRSIFSTNMLFNPKMAYSASIASTRAMLNAPRPMMFAGVMPHQHHGDDSMNKFMMGMMALNMVAEMTKTVTAGIKDIKAAHADRSEKKANTANTTNTTNTTNTNNTTNINNTNSASEDVQDIINNMTNANTSDALQTAINVANDKLSYIRRDIISTKQSEKSQLEGERASLEKDLKEANEAVEKNLEEKTKLLKEKAEKNKKIGELNGKLKNAKTDDEKAKINTQIKGLEKEVSNLDSQITQNRIASNQLVLAQTKAQKAVKDNQESIKSLSDEISTLTSDETALATEIPQQEVRLEELKATEAAQGTNTSGATMAQNLINGNISNDSSLTT